MSSRSGDQLRRVSWTAEATKADPVSTRTSPSSVVKADTLANEGTKATPSVISASPPRWPPTGWSWATSISPRQSLSASSSTSSAMVPSRLGLRRFDPSGRRPRRAAGTWRRGGRFSAGGAPPGPLPAAGLGADLAGAGVDGASGLRASVCGPRPSSGPDPERPTGRDPGGAPPVPSRRRAADLRRLRATSRPSDRVDAGVTGPSSGSASRYPQPGHGDQLDGHDAGTPGWAEGAEGGARLGERRPATSRAAWRRGPQTRMRPRGPRAVRARRPRRIAADEKESRLPPMWTDSTTRATARKYSKSWWRPKPIGRRRRPAAAVGRGPRWNGSAIPWTRSDPSPSAEVALSVSVCLALSFFQALLELRLGRTEGTGQLRDLGPTEEDDDDDDEDDDAVDAEDFSQDWVHGCLPFSGARGGAGPFPQVRPASGVGDRRPPALTAVAGRLPAQVNRPGTPRGPGRPPRPAR